MDLTGQLLIAMPGMGDPRFDHSVVLICAHSDEGAMGLIVNKPTEEIVLRDMLEQLSIDTCPATPEIGVHFGGPVETGRGFVLHSLDYVSSLNTLRVDAEFGLTATLDVLEELAQGKGPQKVLLALGYAGWGPGQLEGEIAQNGWLTCPADGDLIFGADDAAKWEAALQSIGVDSLLLSADAGRA